MSDENPSSEMQPAEPVAMVEAVLVDSTPPRPWFWGALGCCLLMFIVQTAVGTFAVVLWLVASAIATGKTPGSGALSASLPVTLLVGAATSGTLACALLTVAIVYRRRAPRILALRRPAWGQWIVVLLAILPMQVFASEVSNWVAAFVPTWTLTADAFMRLSQESLAGALVFGALLAALGEEIYFRGFVGRGLVARYGPLAGVALTSLLFGLVHLEPVQASGAMVVGAGLHFIFLSTRSLYVPIVVHALNNALAFTAFLLRGRLSLEGFIPGEGNVLAFTPWPLTLASLAALAGLSLVLWDTRGRWILPSGRPWDPGYVTAEQPPAAVSATLHCGSPRIGSIAAAVLGQALFLGALLTCAQWS